MSPNLTGIHHLTAITAQAKENKKFYTDLLGMRLVKKTVNQDDTSAYHLFYADGQASPVLISLSSTGRLHRKNAAHIPSAALVCVSPVRTRWNIGVSA